MQKIIIAILIFSAFSIHTSLAQEEGEIDYELEYTGGVNFNTNAGFIGGFMFKHARSTKKESIFHIFGIEWVNVKHPKELRLSSSTTGNIYTSNKLYYFFPLRLQYGREFLLFGKAREDGVQVDGIIAMGPSMGIQKPYFIEYDYFTETRNEPYDPALHDNNRILGSGGFFKGFDLLKVTPGIHFKSGLSLEFSHFSGNVTGIEFGGMIELYPKKIVILGPDPIQNRSTFSAIYINLFYGTRR